MKRDNDCCPLSKLLTRLKTSSAECNERLEASDALIAEVERELVGMRLSVNVKVSLGLTFELAPMVSLPGYVEWAAGKKWRERKWTGDGYYEGYIDGSLRYGPNATFGTESLEYAPVEIRMAAAAQLKRLLSEAQLKAKAFTMAAEGV